MKAVALDLDGTLLNSKHMVSSYAKQILKKLDSSGIKIVLASARPIRSVLNIATEIGLQNLPMVGGNGAIIAKNENEVLFRNSILKNDFSLLVLLLKKYLSENPQYEMTMHIYSGFKWLIPFHTEKAKEEARIIGFEPDIIGEQAFDADCAEKIMFVAKPEYLKEFVSHLNKEIPHLSAVLSKSDSLEINAVGVSKFLGVSEYAKLNHLSVKDFVVMGDGDNDEMMLLNCGYGVAMANASFLAKKAANHVTLSNDDDGVAKFLESYFFKK
jgi:5-amino-6-(5-phospho-D-ribitylamino)uracil phosphatase